MWKDIPEKSTRFAIERAGLVSKALLVLTLGLLVAAGLPSLLPDQLGFMPQVRIDTDPENMLPSDHPAREFHNQSKELFQLHDAVVVGIVNESHPEGVFNPETLAKVHQLTEFAMGLEGVITDDLMAPSTTDSISNAGPGTLRFDWLMAEPPKTQEEALAVRERAMRIPFLKDTLISGDGRALVIYIPIEKKDLAHDISTALSEEISSIGAGEDRFHIAGLPVAEDTFGIEMFIQMAISAPMAMVVIFALMWIFFRSLIVIAAPMLVAMASALMTMGLLVLSGNTVHIMSSMIPIFIMPIAVLDAVHIISDFFDTYPKMGDRRKTIEKVMNHLFSPMLFTSLTTAAGFASLALTPIPPVQVFGIFVAIGVLIAWLCTIIFVPAYLMLLAPKRLEGFGRKVAHTSSGGILARLGRMGGLQAKLILVVSLGLGAVAAIGIQRINVNDNPTKWFEESHAIRIADKVLNEHFGGTYDAYLQLQPVTEDYSSEALNKQFVDGASAQSEASRAVFAELQEAMRAQLQAPLFDALDSLDELVRERSRKDADSRRRVAWGHAQDFVAAEFESAELQEEATDEPSADAEPTEPVFENAAIARAEAWRDNLESSYAELNKLSTVVSAGKPTSRAQFVARLDEAITSAQIEEGRTLVLTEFIERETLALQVFKQPELLSYMEKLQAALATHASVGKSNSLADIVKVVHRDLISGEPGDYRIPETADVVAQTLVQYQSSHRKDDLWHFVSSDYDKAVIWFQLKSGDNVDMQKVVVAVEEFLRDNPPPISLAPPQWFGLTYINVVWQESMVSGMVSALLGSFVIVLIMMIGLFRSLLWGLLSMIPLTLTVALIYGVLGLVGKDYDMPVAVLSSLSLGLAVDYAIHFLARSRELRASHDSWAEAQVAVFQEPARAISRNVVIVGLGFLPLLLAPLVPYQTVGFLIASILFAAGLATLVLLPALIQILQRFLFRDTN